MNKPMIPISVPVYRIGPLFYAWLGALSGGALVSAINRDWLALGGWTLAVAITVSAGRHFLRMQNDRAMYMAIMRAMANELDGRDVVKPAP